MSKPLKLIPKFPSESAERAFWESRKNDSMGYVDWTKAKLVLRQAAPVHRKHLRGGP